MRIVAGTLRGRPIVAPKGHSTRPTGDRTRQAIFNVLEHAPWAPEVEGARVVDLFAGSGALGLEALSRGAAACWFVEREAAAVGAIGANVRSLGVEALAIIERKDARRLGSKPADARPFDLAFLDPPYGEGLAEQALEALASGGWLAPRAVVVVERGSRDASETSAGYERMDERRWGQAQVSFLQVIAAQARAR